MYQADENCPVELFLNYKSRRPIALRNSGPLYLSVIDKPVSNVWYKSSRMGVHTINKIMKSMKENSALSIICADKKSTNHSARKTTVRKLKSHGVPKCEIKNITGHSSEKGLDAYDSGGEEEMNAMSSILNRVKPLAKSSTISKSSTIPKQQIALQPLSAASPKESNFSFGVD